MARSTHRRRHKHAPAQEGAVMLVVMLIMLVATTTATVAVQSTQYELKGSGYYREATQARYVAEIALLSTLSWIDTIGDSFLNTWTAWEAGGPPNMMMYGEPPVTAAVQHHASRVFQTQVEANQTGVEDTATGLLAGGDTIGSLGPRSSLMAHRFVVDITDCQQSTGGHTPGAPIGGGGGAVKVVTFYCTMTARARLCARMIDGGGNFLEQCAVNPDQVLDATERGWDVDSVGGLEFYQDRFAVAHDARATFLTPEMIVPVE